MSESNIDIAKRCYPIGTKYIPGGCNVSKINDSPPDLRKDGWIGTEKGGCGIIHKSGKDTWAKIILPEPKVGMRVQRGPEFQYEGESQGDGTCGVITYIPHNFLNYDTDFLDVKWDNGDTNSYEWSIQSVIPVTPEFDTGNKPKKEPQSLFTIQDLADGKCAVINDGTKEELEALLKIAFPEDPARLNLDSEYYTKKYYFISHCSKGFWSFEDTCDLPKQSIKDFPMKLESDEEFVPTDFGTIEVGDTVECITTSKRPGYTPGAGWSKGLIFKVTKLNNDVSETCYFGGEAGCGVYKSYLKLMKKGSSSQPVSESKSYINKQEDEQDSKVQIVSKQDNSGLREGGIRIQSRRGGTAVKSGHLKHQEIFISSKKTVRVG